MALLMLSSAAVIVFNIAADVLHAAIDPRLTA
jgi:ABC-type dipeptide/oligopeptide/nickel transport system permease component